MGILNPIRSLIGSVKVVESNGKITVSALKTKNMFADIYSLWRTNRIAKSMFIKVSPYEIEFYSFFAVEFVYIVDKLLEFPKLNKTSKRSLVSVKNAMLENTWLKSTQEEHDPILNRSKLSLFKFTPKEHQDEFFDKYDNVVPRFRLRGYTLAMGTGTGKAQVLSSLIKVPGGWKRMGDIKVGDPVIAQDGTVTNVTGVHPQGVTRVYRVIFADGRYTDVNPEHLWEIRYRADKGSLLLTTEEIKERLERGTSISRRMAVPLAIPEDSPDIDLPIDPYILGVILGDGHIGEKAVTVSKYDKFIWDKVSSRLPNDLVISELPSSRGLTFSIICKDGVNENSLMWRLRDLGLAGKNAVDKFVPEIYLNGSIKQRLELLQGLMDTDGTVDLNSPCVSYSSSSENLAKSVQYLVRSLGGIARISTKVPTYVYKGEKKTGALHYRVNIRIKKASELFTLPRKLQRAELSNQYSEHLSLRVEKIIEIGMEETQCISISHPRRLYVTDDFIVTHNTYTSLALSQMLGSDFTIIITLKRAVYRVWEKSMKEDFRNPPKYWIYDRDKELKGNPPPFLIFHVEDLRYFKEIASKFRGKKVTLILDESHTLNEETSGRNNIMYEAWKIIEPMSTIWASATPLKAYGTEAITMLRTIDPLMNDDVAEAFRKLYGKSSNKVFDIISHRLGNIVFKAEVVKTEPKIERVPVKIPDPTPFLLTTLKKDMEKFIKDRLKYWEGQRGNALKYYNESLAIFEKALKSPQQKQQFALYRKMFNVIVKTTDYPKIRDTIVFVNKYEKNVLLPALDNERRKKLRSYLSVIKYVELKVRGECLGSLVSKRREEAVEAVMRHAKIEKYIEEAEKKTVVFTSYVKVVDECAKYLKGKGIQPLVVHGSSEGTADSEVKKFETGKERAMVTTFQSLSSAVPMTMANTILALNVPFRSYNMEQAIGRIDRIDQDAPTFVFEFVLDTGDQENINSRTFDILEWSTDQVNSMLNIPDGV
ncbi:helicase superfamily 1/2/ATP-binding domain-containing protein [Serratia phage BUCT660]|nr:helicase superfamily 1/2/ATP-binding domain-containing protein [Serratia phage BUCT660]